MEIVYLYPGVHPLYAVGAFVCAIIMSILITRTVYNKRYGTTGINIYLFVWVFFFCIQDGVWGLFAAHVIDNTALLFVTSTIFHLCSAITAYVWVSFHVTSLKDKIIHPLLIRVVALSVVASQIVLLVINCFTKFMFYVDETGEYTSTSYRKILFYLQFATYIAIGIVSMIKLIRSKKAEDSQDLMATFCMNISPIFFGIFQMLYPDAPANSIGFSLSCIIYFTFIAANYERQITEYRARADYQAIIERQNKELIEQKSLLQKALQAEEKANRAKTQFLFNMSHDIRTPMNAIIGFTTMAKRRIGDTEKTAEYIEKIDIIGHQLLSLINQVLEMSRIESGEITLSKQKSDIRDFAEMVKTVYEDTAANNGITLRVNVENVTHNNIITDGDRVKQIITNLLGNAIKYTPDGGYVDFSINEIGTDEAGNVMYEFIVQDTGIGMSDEFVSHIFDVFSREDTSMVNRVQGTGLGMSIVKRLADVMNGTIDIQSQKDEGTKVIVTLPMTIDTDTEVVKETEIEEISINGMRILLVDDNEMNRELATELLEDEGAVIDTAVDGEDAYEKVMAMYSGSVPQYDCVLMDIQMPRLNGYEATEKIREVEPEGKHLPIIALSANAFEEDRQKSLASGMDAHIAKPIIISELLSMLRKHCHS